jgi:hypothetical protein
MEIFRSRPRWQLLAGLCSDHDQSQTSNQRNCAEDGGDGQCVLSLVRDLDRADIDIFFLMRERDAAGRVSDDAKDDEEYSNNGCGFHK